VSHFTFDEAHHHYVLEPDEHGRGHRRVPSVTQVLEHAGMSPDFSHLDPYYMERGSAIHRAVALDMLGKLDESTLDERIIPYVENARTWLSSLEVTPLIVEFRWVHTVLEYGGTLDLFCESKLGLLLIDWKAVIYDRSYAIQLAGGYRPMLINAAEAGAVPVTPGDVAEARMAVVTLATEFPKAHWVPIDINPELFQAALTCSRWRTANKR